MSRTGVERKLTAILSGDVVGYSSLMGVDEEGTLEALKAHRTHRIGPCIDNHNGHIVKLMGDGMLVEFPSVVDAVRCAVEMQGALATFNVGVAADKRIELRVGVNLGDIIVEGDDIYGDGVNVTARLEALSDPGGICISGTVYEHVHNKLDLAFDDLGEHEVKHIREPVRVYKVSLKSGVSRSPAPAARPKRKSPAVYLPWGAAVGVGLAVGVGATSLWPVLFPGQENPPAEPAVSTASLEAGPGLAAIEIPDRPSIAVLPFDNMSDDPEQEYFSDGITEDLITDLSRISGLLVIARNSVFRYKGVAVKMQDVSRDLGVRYVLEGSVRRVGDRIRITAQLIDATTGYHIWAERYDRKLDDVFAVQDEVAKKIVATLEVKLSERERNSLSGGYTNSIAAYDVFLRGVELFHHFVKEDNQAARALFHRAIELDPNYARAYANLAWTYQRDFADGWAEDPELSLRKARELARRALELDESLPPVHWIMGDILLFQRDHEKAAAEVEKVLALDPNYADGYILAARVLSYSGKPKEAVKAIRQAMRLNPYYPQQYLFNLGIAYFTMRDYEKAIAALKQGLERNAAAQRPRMWLAASYAQAGRVEEAQWEASELLLQDPGLSLDWIGKVVPYRDPRDLNRFIDALKAAGLPD